MSKPQVRTSANGHTDAVLRARSVKVDPAAALIAKASRGTAKDEPPAEAVAALRKLCAHNDTQTSNVKKVGSGAAIEMLHTHYGWKGVSLSSLNSVCRRILGRKSWGTP
jgi:hypothetical protein